MSSFDDPSQEEVRSLVSSVFQVKGISQNLDALQFEIEEEGFKEKFVHLVRTLELKDLAARLERFDGRLFVLIGRFRSPPSGRAWVPRILFAVTVAMVMIDGYFRTTAANSIVKIGDPLEVAVLYTAALIGILGIHELGHMVAAKWHRLRTTWPYFIPGIPVLGIPTFGAFIQSRAMMVNRDTLFDIGISGPIAGLVVAVIVLIFGVYFAPVIPETLAREHFAHSELIAMHENIIMSLMLSFAGKIATGTEVIMTPVLFAAWLGFLITFLNLLPAWQLDGGHIARAMFGGKVHRILTFVSVGILILLGYWFMAIYILSFGMRSPGVRPLDDISPLSRKRKIAFGIVIALATLTAPLPSKLLS